MDEITQQRIDRYLRKEMSPEESINFEQDVLNDENLRKELEVTFLLKKSLDARQQKLQQIKKWSNKRRQFLSLKILSAISVAAILTLIFFICKPNSQQHTTQKLVAQNDKIVKTQQKAQKVIQSVKSSLEKGNDSEAMFTLNDWETSPEKITMNKLTCDSQAVFLSQSDKNLLKQDLYELQWLKICLLIKQGNEKEAILLLKSYVNIEGNYREKADSILKSLEK